MRRPGLYHVTHKFSYKMVRGSLTVTTACTPRKNSTFGSNVWDSVTCKNCLKRRKR